MWFEAMSNLKITLEKSALIPVGGVDDVEALVVTMGCKVEHLPSTYIGFPLGVPFKAMWDGLEENFQ